MWRFLLAPLWVRLVCSIVMMSGVAAALIGLLCLRNPAIWQDHIVPNARWVLAGVAAFGVVVGIAVTMATRRSSAECAQALRGLTTAQKRAAYVASHRGRAPRDPVAHAAAVRLCEVLHPPDGRAAWTFVAILTIAALAQVPGFAVAVASGEWRQAVVPGTVLVATGVAAAAHSLNIRRFQRQYLVLTTAHDEFTVGTRAQG